LIVTADPAVLDELLRLCAAAAVEPTVAADSATVSRAWARAPIVLLGADVAGRSAAQAVVATRSLPRRAGTICVGMADHAPWEVARELGIDQVAVLPSAGAWLVEMLARPIETCMAAPVVCVVAGHGGAGATTLAAALARTSASAGSPTLLIDGDPLGAGIDLALGIESATGDRWPQVLGPAATVTSGFFDRLPARGGLHVLAMDRQGECQLSAAAMNGALAEARSRCELVVIDLPRRIDPAGAAALAAAELICLVTAAQVRAIAAARRVAAQLAGGAAPLRAVVRGPAPGGPSPEAVASMLGIPVAGAIRPEPGLDRNFERGVPPGRPGGPLGRLSARLIAELPARRPASGPRHGAGSGRAE
jgi:secretion/DNA translocation related CpaE-like protein